MADDSRNTDAGERYARALFDLAVEAGQIGAVETDLRAIKAMHAESQDLRRLIASPAFSAEQKGLALQALAEKAEFQTLTKKFLGLLTRNGRAGAILAVADAYLKLAAAHRGAVSAEITSAVPLSQAQTSGIAAALRQALGKDPELNTRVDPSILGGLRVRVGSRLYDASLKSRLDQLKFALKRA